jgi:hypothetical protein
MSLADTMRKQLGDSTYDALMVVPHPEKDGMLQIEFLKYKESGEKHSPNDLGDWHEIFLFQEDKDGEFINKDRFSAVLLDPIEYSSRLAKGGVYGIIGKKTSTSDSFFDDIEKKWDEE